MTIRLQDAMTKNIWPRILTRQTRPKVIARYQDFRIVLPSRLSDGSFLVACRGVLGVFAVASLFAVMAMLLTIPSLSWLPVATGLFIISTSLYGCFTFLVKRQIIFSQHDVAFHQTLLGMTLERSPHYTLRQIQQIRVDAKSDRDEAYLVFEHHGTPTTCPESCSRHMASQAVVMMSEILQSSCSSVERIIFGHPRVTTHNPETTLQNPDVSHLSLPFVRLRHVVIYADTYSLPRLEQFLTYVLNTYKTAYFKKYVTVDVYGERQDFHPNLWNNLTHLCKSISLHHSTLPPWQEASGEEEKT
jgi:hypothetical protein